jgi:hypothetical protein
VYKGYLTGVDENHEWMLPWWFSNLRKYSSLPICIHDYGMSEEMSSWAKKHFDHYKLFTKHPKCAWFYITKSLLESPFDKTVWLDSDCEVVSYLDDIFDYIKPNMLSLTLDPGRQGSWWGTGVVGVQGFSRILLEWHKTIETEEHRGDQEALKSLLDNSSYSSSIITMPQEYQWLRLQLHRKHDTPNKKVVHWTGPIGKEIIKQKIKEQQNAL